MLYQMLPCLKLLHIIRSTIMLSLCQKLTVNASQCGMADFRDKYANIEKLVKYWESSTP